MLSFGPRSPLNFNTTTVTLSPLPSHVFSSLLFSSPAASKHRQKIRSLSPLSTVVPSSSLYSSFFWLIIVVVLSYLMCQNLVSAAPLDTASHNASAGSSHHLGWNNATDNATVFQGEMPQNDEPPRSIYPSYTVPASWKRQSQERVYYLRAENDQFLQFYGNQITGTKVTKPALGIVRFLSHKESMVIVGFLEEKYLCMNATSALYLSDKIDPECYIEESSLLESGSHATTYDFIKYKTSRKLYLGINCDPMLGSETNQSMKATRFSRLDISQDEAEAVRKAVANAGLQSYVEDKCEKIHERKSAARLKRRKLRYRWCWNIDRMIAHRMTYLQQCRERESPKCDINYAGENSEECVCNILMRMLTKPKRAKRRCLVEKITKWVKHQNSTPNSAAIVEASRLLLPSYSAIARRMHSLKTKQSQLQDGNTDGKATQKTHLQSTPENAKKVGHHTAVQSSSQHHIRHQCRQDSSQKCRHKSVKLNSILEEYQHELVLSTNDASVGSGSSLTTQRLLAAKNVSSPAGKHTDTSVLSKQFKKALKALTKTNSETRTKPQTSRKTKQSRPLHVSQKKPKHRSTTVNRKRPKTHRDSELPG